MLDPRSGVPRWRQLADLLREQISSGMLAAGSQMPSETRLGQEHGVGRATVRRAIAALRAEGLVVVEHGYGTRVSAAPDRAAVSVPAGARVISRMPTADERAVHDLPDGVPVLVVTYGDTVRVYAADRTALTFE